MKKIYFFFQYKQKNNIFTIYLFEFWIKKICIPKFCLINIFFSFLLKPKRQLKPAIKKADRLWWSAQLLDLRIMSTSNCPAEYYLHRRHFHFRRKWQCRSTTRDAVRFRSCYSLRYRLPLLVFCRRKVLIQLRHERQQIFHVDNDTAAKVM